MKWYLPGLGYEENCLPKAQAKLGHEVTVVTTGRVPIVFKDTPHFAKLYPHGKSGTGRLRENSIEIIRQPSLRGPYDQLVILGLRKILKELGPEIVHSHSALSPTSVQCVFLQPRFRYKLFIDDHSTDLNTQLNNPLKTLYTRSISSFYKTHDEAVARYLPVTTASARFLTDNLNIPRRRLTVVGLGADAMLFHQSDEARRLYRGKLGISDDEILVVSSGKFRRQKLITDLLTAFARVMREQPRMRLLLVGDASYSEMSQITAISNNLGINGRMIVHPFADRSELSQIYNAADIGVWPGEPSITVLEALATGLACVLPISEAAYDLILESHACAPFAKGDVIDLASKIQRLVNDPPYRDRLRAAALDLVARRLSWDAISKKLLALYDESVGEER